MSPFRRRRDKRYSPTGRFWFAVVRLLGIGADGHVGPHGPARRTVVPPAGYWRVGAVVLLTLVLAL